MRYKKAGNDRADFRNIRYIEIDLKDKGRREFYGVAMDYDLKMLGRVVIKANDDEFLEVCNKLKRGLNVFDVCNPKYGNIVCLGE